MLSFFVIIFVIQDVHKTYFNISVLEIKIFNKKHSVFDYWVDLLIPRLLLESSIGDHHATTAPYYLCRYALQLYDNQ